MFRKSLKNLKYLQTDSGQSGITLLLSILVLSALVAISFSFATIILVEIRASGDVSRTEPAFYAVQGVVEEVIFKVKRGVPDTVVTSNDFNFGACPNPNPQQVTAGVNVATQNSVTLFSGICNRNPQYDVKDTVAPTSGGDVVANAKNIYNVYDPSNPYTNTYNGFDSAYSKVEFHYLSSPGASSKIYFCPVDTDCFTTGLWTTATLDSSTQCRQFYDSATVPLTSGCISSGTIKPNKAYQFFVVNPNLSAVAGIEIISSGPDPQNNPLPTQIINKGLPSFGQFAVDVTASSLGLTRKYQVIIPNE